LALNGKFETDHLSSIRKWYINLAMTLKTFDLNITRSASARVEKMGEQSWHLEIPADASRVYRLAQLDDHKSLSRRNFPWRPPLKLLLQARVSVQALPGTWGFGLWNDPFSFLLSYNKAVPRLPTLPDAIWFFHASPQNYLSFRDNLPSNGFLAATFSSQKVRTILLAIASPALALTLLPYTAQFVRTALRRVIHQDASQIHVSVTEWHEYLLEWHLHQVRFYLDGAQLLQTDIAPAGPLSLVIWIDNQYAALPPRGRLRYGNLPNSEPAWMEIRELSIQDES
jgi:hypothetical protein